MCSKPSGIAEIFSHLTVQSVVTVEGTVVENKAVKVGGKEMLDKINELGIGPQGFGGKTTAIGLNIETLPTHIAGMPCAININCHVTRHKTEVI